MARERLVVVGADAAGMSAASQARRRRGPDDLEVVALDRGRWTSYSACGIPYWVGDVVDGPEALVARWPDEFRERQHVDVRLLVGFFLPGDTLLFAAGLLVGDESRGLSLTLLITLVVGAAITGDSVGFVIGRRGGRAVLIRREGKALGPDALARVDRFMETWGVLSVIIARWIPWLRTFVPVAAGASDLPYPRFLMANVVGALCWGVTLPLLGYLAASTPWLQGVAGVVAAVVVTVAIVGGVVTRLRQRRRQTQS